MGNRKQFINWLRILAAICITNSHFGNVWPIEGIASGGMLGDVLFFAISGYCLYHSDFKLWDFGRWYIKRIRRIYITVILIVLLTCFLTVFPTTVQGWIYIFIYPTQYHFVASIMVLYIVYYLWMNILKRWKIRIWVSGCFYAVFVLVVYIIAFDKSWYHIDVVEDHFIRFLFFAAMLLGAHLREREYKELDSRSLNVNVWKTSLICVMSVIMYFVVRIMVPKFELFTVQFITWITILAALYSILRWAETLEPLLLRIPAKIRRGLQFIAGITLQIYLVQFPIIERFETLVFPLNLLVITVLIFVAATIVYWADSAIQKGIKMIKINVAKLF